MNAMVHGARGSTAARIIAAAFLPICLARLAAGHTFSPEEVRQIVRLSPLPPPPLDHGNRVADDPDAARLGQMLFFAPSLSRRGDVACATCHDPARGWSNARAVVPTGTLFPRHVPSLWNTAYNRWFFWDGRADSAWAQALGPLENGAEMATTRLRVAHQLAADRALRRAYERLFGPLPDLTDRQRFPADGRPMPGDVMHPHHVAWARMADADRETVDKIFSNVGKAIAAYERQIISRDAPFDRFVEGLRDGDAAKLTALSEAAQRGLRLFIGRGECVLCHNGPNFTDGEFHDIGIALGKERRRIDPGRYGGVRVLLADPFNRAGRFSDRTDPLAPVRFLHLQSDQLAQFKTPSLRDVAGSAPYMHDGRFGSLEAVVRFYSTRDGATPLGHPVNLLRPLNLADGEVADLVVFLRSLSGRPLARSLTARP